MPPHDPKEYLPENKVSLTLDGDLLNPANTTKPAQKTTYPFVDLIRFVATIGIVFIHTEIHSDNADSNTVLHQVKHAEYYFLLRQLFKFSTICYFMISGFLLADKSIDSKPFDYYKRRLRVIARPYVLAVFIFVALLVISNALIHRQFQLSYVIAVIKYTVLYTAFWYIPNYFLCLLVIVCFSRYLGSLYFGAVLLLITLCYTYLDVYSHNYTTSHTTALFGFVFYLWLGVYIKKRDLVSRIQKANPVLLGGLLLFIYLLCNAESYYLFYYTNTHDSLNTLRLSNQLYSVAVFVFLIRCCGKAPKFGIFNPRKETYGIYLYHSFFIFFIIPLVENWISKQFHVSFFSYNVFGLILITLLNFIVCYFATTALVKLLLRWKLAYLPE